MRTAAVCAQITPYVGHTFINREGSGNQTRLYVALLIIRLLCSIKKEVKKWSDADRPIL